jgi:hypothetical protein
MVISGEMPDRYVAAPGELKAALPLHFRTMN